MRGEVARLILRRFPCLSERRRIKERGCEKKKENSTRERRGRGGGEGEAKNSVFKAANQRPFYENRVCTDATGSNAA